MGDWCSIVGWEMLGCIGLLGGAQFNWVPVWVGSVPTTGAIIAAHNCVGYFMPMRFGHRALINKPVTSEKNVELECWEYVVAKKGRDNKPSPPDRRDGSVPAPDGHSHLHTALCP